MAFPVVMYGCETWTVKKVEHQRPDTFKLWCWRRSLESTLDCKEIGNQPRIQEGLMLKLKLQYFGHLMRRADSLGKTLMLGKIEGKKRLDIITNSMDMNLSKLWDIVKDRGGWHAAVHGVAKSQT